jgi:hypothetical protein
MAAPENPRIPGLEARFTHLDAEDPPWIAVRSQANADSSESHVWERWISFSVEPLYLALFARWDPGMIVRRHGHHSPHTLLVLEGSVSCDGVECGPGTHIELPHGAGFGPFVAGPAGLVAYEVMMGGPRAWSDEPAAMTAGGPAGTPSRWKRSTWRSSPGGTRG